MVSTKPFAFVLMPFEEAFADIYKLGIQAVAHECGVVAERVDEQTFSETILERIYRQIDAADFVIADMTGRNPNVFYEVGYAHARGKLCTLLTQSVEDIPFDLRHHRHIVYGGSIQTLKAKLQREIEWLKSERERRNAKSIAIDIKSVIGDLRKSENWADADVEFKFDINNNTVRKSPEIEAIYIHTGEGWIFTQAGEDCPRADSDQPRAKVKHFVKSPISRLSPGAWAQIVLKGTKPLWSKWKGEELRDRYDLNGYLIVEVFTSEGNFSENLNVSVQIAEVPF